MAGEHGISMQARLNYPFELENGGEGLELNATSTASVAQPLAMTPGKQIVVTNDSPNTWRFVIGDSHVRATLACMPVLPGVQLSFSVPTDGRTYTHISVICRSGLTAYGTANVGFGS